MKCRRVAALVYDGDAFQGLTPLAIDLGRVAADVEARLPVYQTTFLLLGSQA